VLVIFASNLEVGVGMKVLLCDFQFFVMKFRNWMFKGLEKLTIYRLGMS
jgi:hypothetical protein